MKLNEIIDFKHEIKSASDLKPGVLQGRGFFSKVYTDQDDPHMVIKQSKFSDQLDTSDGYYKYIEATIKNGMNGVNPYVPRVYKINAIDTGMQLMKGVNSYNHEVQIEKLNVVYDLDIKDIEFILSKIFPEDLVSSLLSKESPNEIFESVSDILFKILKGTYTIKKTLSKDLNQVLELIKKLYDDKIITEIDLKPANLMIRRSPYGPQLVITDPAA
jgi:hypothetical protein